MSESLLIIPRDYNLIVPSTLDSLIDKTPYYQRTKELTALLIETGVLTVNSDNDSPQFSNFLANNPKGSPIGIILGYIAEGIVVRECNHSKSINKKWSDFARMLKEENNLIIKTLKSIFYSPFQQNSDEYTAIGTGLIATKKNHPAWYSRTSNRDICWVNTFKKAQELLTLEGLTKNRKNNAGIQLKVSCAEDGRYVTDYFKKKNYHFLYPVVYFDLGGDYSKVRETLMKITANEVQEFSLFSDNIQISGYSRDEILQMMLLRGKDIAPELHDELKYYQSVLSKIKNGRIQLFNLTDDKVIMGLITEYLRLSCDGDSISPLLTLAM
jgi:hypothetical protein